MKESISTMVLVGREDPVKEELTISLEGKNLSFELSKTKFIFGREISMGSSEIFHAKWNGNLKEIFEKVLSKWE